jgi:hypothetical protein
MQPPALDLFHGKIDHVGQQYFTKHFCPTHRVHDEDFSETVLIKQIRDKDVERRPEIVFSRLRTAPLLGGPVADKLHARLRPDPVFDIIHIDREHVNTFKVVQVGKLQGNE